MSTSKWFSAALFGTTLLLAGSASAQLGRIIGSNDLGGGLMIWDLDNGVVCTVPGPSFPNTVGYNGTNIYHVTGDSFANPSPLPVWLVPQPNNPPDACAHVPATPTFYLEGNPGGAPVHIEDLAFTSACNLWGADVAGFPANSRLVEWNICDPNSVKPAVVILPITGFFKDNVPVVSPSGIASTPQGMFASMGAFGRHEIGVIDLNTGVYTAKWVEPIGLYDSCTYIHSLAYDSSRQVLWENLSFAFGCFGPGQVVRQRNLDGSSAGPDVVLNPSPVSSRFDGFEHLSQPVGVPGRMTGGGSVGTPRVTHGFELHCDADTTPNNLEVNWGGGNNFHLTSLTSATCSNEANLFPAPPNAGFNTYKGTGTGVCNGSLVNATWTFTDAGEPGRSDSAKIHVDSGGNCPGLDVSGNLSSGNQQAHDH